MIIMYAQKPIAIECFGSISCDRDRFKKASSISSSANHSFDVLVKNVRYFFTGN